MAVLTLKSDDFKRFPQILKDYASYTVTIKGNSEKTVCEYLLDIRTFFRYLKMKKAGDDLSREEFEKLSISDLTIDNIREVTTEKVIEFLMFAGFERENSTTTRMRKLSSLKSLFHYLYGKKRLLDSNPTAEVDAPKKGQTLPKYLTLEEAVRLLETVKSDTNSKTVQRDYSIIALFMNTGMRLSELVGLNLESFDSELNFVKVLGKGNKERIIYLNKAAKDAVASYLRIRLDPRFVRTSDRAFFLSGRQQRISAKTVQWIIYRYLDLAGLGSKGLSVHKLRHTAATLMYQYGNVDIRALQELLGHESIATTEIYTHVDNSQVRDAIENNPLANYNGK